MFSIFWATVRILLALAVLAAVSLGAIAWNHARSLTNYAAEGAKPSATDPRSPMERLRALVLGTPTPRPTNARNPKDVGLPFEVVSLARERGGKLEAWWIPASRGGAGKGVILGFPDYGRAKASLLGRADALHALGWSVVLVDFHGAGGSSGATTTFGIEEAGDVATVAQWAETTHARSPIVFYGLGMGGAAVLRSVAELGMLPNGLVVEATFDRFHTAIERRLERLRLPRRPWADLLLYWIGGWPAFAHDPVLYAERVRCPSLVLKGALDEWVTNEEANEIRLALPAGTPLALVPGARHGNAFAAAARFWQRRFDQVLVEAAKHRSARGAPP